MADSKLFPNFLARRTKSANLPFYATCFGQFLAVLLSVFGFLFPASFKTWPSIISLFAFFTYGIQLIGFLSLKLKLNRFPREFSSPFGIPGALYALIVFVIGFIMCIVSNFYSIIVAVIYFLWARHRQMFSAAEKLVMLPVHAEIKNANGKRLKPLIDSVDITFYLCVYRVFVLQVYMVGNDHQQLLQISSWPR
jgi:amino acid transporter